jgi:hypothetical protein
LLATGRSTRLTIGDPEPNVHGQFKVQAPRAKMRSEHNRTDHGLQKPDKLTCEVHNRNIFLILSSSP